MDTKTTRLTPQEEEELDWLAKTFPPEKKLKWILTLVLIFPFTFIVEYLIIKFKSLGSNRYTAFENPEFFWISCIGSAIIMILLAIAVRQEALKKMKGK